MNRTSHQEALCDAIVLGSMEYRESDRLITLFTSDLGKLRALARGARRSIKRFSGGLELFSWVKGRISPREGLSILHETDIVSAFPQIRRTLSGIASAGYACELVDLLLPEAMPNLRLFRLLGTYLQHLDRSPHTPDDRHFYEMNLLNILGYRPPIDNCGSCGTPLASSGGHPCTGGSDSRILCPSCTPEPPSLSPLTLGLLADTLRTGRFGVITFPADERCVVEKLMNSAIDRHLSRPLRSRGFLQEMGE